MREHGFLLPAKRPSVDPKVHEFKRRQYLPRPARGGGQVLFRLALGRACWSGSGSSLLFFWPLPMNEPLDPIGDNHDEDSDDFVEDEATQQESESLDDPELENRKIFTDKCDPPIGALYMKYEAGDL